MYKFPDDNCALVVESLGCINKKPISYLYMVKAILVCVIGLIGLGLLWHRVVTRKLNIFYRGSGYFIRPKSIDSMLLFLSLTNMAEVLRISLLLFNDPPIFFLTTFSGTLPRQLTTCAFSCYIFGVTCTVCSSQVLGGASDKTSKRIDIVCTLFIILPFVTCFISNIMFDFYLSKPDVDAHDFYMAYKFKSIEYFQWLAYWTILLIWGSISGSKLINLLKTHICNQWMLGGNNSVSIQNARQSIFKVRLVMAIGISYIMIFIICQYSHELPRHDILDNFAPALLFLILLECLSLFASILYIMIILYNPKILDPISSMQNEPPEFYINTSAIEPSLAEHIDESTLVTSDIGSRKDNSSNQSSEHQSNSAMSV